MLLCFPPSITREVYCFPRHRLIFRFGRRVIHHSKGLNLRVHSEIDSVCPSVPRSSNEYLDIIFMLNI